MKKYLPFLFFILWALPIFGQITSDSIAIKKSFGVSQFYQYDKKVNFKKLVKVMKSNEQAYPEIRAAEYTYFMVNGLNGAGRFFILLPLIFVAADKEPNWYLAGIGAGLLVINIPFTRKFNKQVALAVDTFNAGVKTSLIEDKAEFDMSIAGNGLNLQVRF